MQIPSGIGERIQIYTNQTPSKDGSGVEWRCQVCHYVSLASFGLVLTPFLSDSYRDFLMDIWKSEFVEKLSHSLPSEWDVQIGLPAWDNARIAVALPVLEETSADSTLPTGQQQATSGGPQDRPRRTIINPRKTVEGILSELSQVSYDPYHLIEPFRFGDAQGIAPNESQPFRVVVHPQALLLCDTHCQLSTAEVIGLLGGRWDSTERVLYIQAAFPCTATLREDNGATDVEMEATAEFVVRETVAKLDLSIVGWYHSHPKFAPDPSIIDLANHYGLQTAFRDPITGLEPFVGLIISTAEKDNPSLLSQPRWFMARDYEKRAVLPLLVEVELPTLLPIEPGVDESAQISSALDKILSLERERDMKSSLKEAVASPPPHTTSGDARKGKKKLRRDISTEFETKVKIDLASLPPPPLQEASINASLPSNEVEQQPAEGEERRRPRRANNNRLNEAIQALLNTTQKGNVRGEKKGNKSPVPAAPSPVPPPPPPPAVETIEEKEKPRKAKAPATTTQHPLYASFLSSLGNQDLESAVLARRLLAVSPPHLLSTSAVLVTLGFYYSRFTHRTDVLAAWRGMRRIDKIRLCIQRWLQPLRLVSAEELQQTGVGTGWLGDVNQAGKESCFFDLFLAFLVACWKDFTKSGRLKRPLSHTS